MAIAYLGPAVDHDHVSSPNRSDGLPAGPRAPLPRRTGSRRKVDLLAIAERFAVSAAAVPELQGPTERTWVLLALTDLFEAWALGWPPGGTIELHDHGLSHGAVVVAAGELVETTVRPTTRGVALIGTHHIVAGEHRQFGPRYVHDLRNGGEQQAVSVHVYGPRLSEMSYYEMDERGRLAVVRTEEISPPGPFDSTGDHDPS